MTSQESTSSTDDSSEADNVPSDEEDTPRTLGGCMWCDKDGCDHGARLVTAADIPAGPPLHEPTDRDDANIPSDEDRVREYAEAILSLPEWEMQPAYGIARACVEVEKRHTAVLESALNWERDAACASVQRQRVAEVRAERERAEEAEATIARVEAFLDWLDEAFDGCEPGHGCTGCEIRAKVAALRGPEPTEGA